MKHFDAKWQECAARARRRAPAEASVPEGFCARVVSRMTRPGQESWEGLWMRFSLPALTASALLLLLATVLYWKSPSPLEDGLRPPLENAIIEQIRLL